jgi:hypothetical protein
MWWMEPKNIVKFKPYFVSNQSNLDKRTEPYKCWAKEITLFVS